jgi:Ca2+-binding RTX toxin-like protein
VTVNLGTATATGGHAIGDTISGFENVTGSRFNDTLTGNGGGNEIKGGAGADSLDGRGGIDTLSYAGSAAGVTVNLLTNSAAGGDAAGDAILNFENLIGSDFNDVLTGGAGANRLTGGLGKDVLRGIAGNDVFDFNALADSGPASAARDFIADFTFDPAAGAAVVDRIDLATIDAMAGTGGNQAFAFIGGDAFTAEGQVRAVQAGANAIVQVNTAGAGGAEMTVTLANVMAAELSTVDFIL